MLPAVSTQPPWRKMLYSHTEAGPFALQGSRASQFDLIASLSAVQDTGLLDALYA